MCLRPTRHRRVAGSPSSFLAYQTDYPDPGGTAATNRAASGPVLLHVLLLTLYSTGPGPARPVQRPPRAEAAVRPQCAAGKRHHPASGARNKVQVQVQLRCTAGRVRGGRMGWAGPGLTGTCSQPPPPTAPSTPRHRHQRPPFPAGPHPVAIAASLPLPANTQLASVNRVLYYTLPRRRI